MIKKTLYFGNPAYLSLNLGQLTIKLPQVEKSGLPDFFKEQVTTTRPIEDIGVIVLDNKQITITQGLIEALLENNCAIITCDSKRMPVGLMLPLCGNSIQQERFQEQVNASLPLRKQLWQQTVKAKIDNQAKILSLYTNTEIRCMIKWSNDVKSGDSDNLEARAAAYYWKNIFANFDKYKSFTRNKDGEAPNGLLNYGYAILRAVVARGLVSSGLLPTFGIHHHNRYNAYCLADDIMEPYRPYIDELVYKLLQDNQNEDFNNIDKFKAHLLSIPVLDVNIDGKRSPLMIAVTQTTASLYKCFNGSQRKIIYPER